MKEFAGKISKKLFVTSSFILLLALILSFTPVAYLNQYLRFIWYTMFLGWAFVHGYYTGIDYVIGGRENGSKGGNMGKT